MREVDDITSQQLSSKIKPSSQFCGLYPDIIEDYSYLFETTVKTGSVFKFPVTITSFSLVIF